LSLRGFFYAFSSAFFHFSLLASMNKAGTSTGINKRSFIPVFFYSYILLLLPFVTMSFRSTWSDSEKYSKEIEIVMAY
jgi:hypothetical protein